ncbi:hypothetical protein ACHAXR_007551 [Thalassiosira sp. AJA248-18]
MSWTQVFVSGLPKSVDPSNEEIENMLDRRFNLTDDHSLMWAGRDTTLIKRDESGSCRGFGFLTFYSAEGASIIVERINNESEGSRSDDGSEIMVKEYAFQLKAELSNPKGAKERSKAKSQKKDEHLPDVRLRKQRKAPIRKHPVITSSNGKRTNLGNKTK